MDALMVESNQSEISTRQKEIESVWRGEDQTEAELDENRTTLKERVETP